MTKQTFIPSKEYITEEVIKLYNLIPTANWLGASFATDNRAYQIKEGVPDNIELLLFTCHLDNEKSGFDSDLCTLLAFYMVGNVKVARPEKFSPLLFERDGEFTKLVESIVKEVTNE